MFANLAGKASNHLTVFAAGCIACGSPGSGSAELGPVRTVSTTSAPIIGGVDSPSTDNAVVQVAAFKGGELTRDVASGTLVAPNLVMTARHNVAPQLQTEDRVDCRPGKTQVMFGPTVPVDDRRVFVGPESRSYSANPAGALRIKRIIVGPSLALCDSDVAFLILEQPIHDIEPASLRLFSPPSVSETVSVVGFGFSSSTGDRAAVRQRLDGLQITGYTPKDGMQTDVGEGTGRILMDARDRAPCIGDSGAPVFAAEGVAIGVIAMYFTTNVQTVDPLEIFRDCLNSTWLADSLYDRRELALEAFALAGHPYEGDRQGADSVPIGTPCEKDLDCGPNLCVIIGGDGVCASDCADAPCPDGFSCTSAGGAKLCLKQYEAAPSESGCSMNRSSSPGQGLLFALALLAGLACMRGRLRRAPGIAAMRCGGRRGPT